MGEFSDRRSGNRPDSGFKTLRNSFLDALLPNHFNATRSDNPADNVPQNIEHATEELAAESNPVSLGEEREIDIDDELYTSLGPEGAWAYRKHGGSFAQESKQSDKES